MEIRFLGTGAADWPNVASQLVPDGGRRFTSTLLGEHILIDTAPQSFDYACTLGIDLTKITDIFITHAHADHYCRKSLMDFLNAAEARVRLWCHKGAICSMSLSEEDLLKCELRFLEPLDCVSTEYFSVTALQANHEGEDSRELPLHYLFSLEGKRIFYGCDGGWFTAQTWEYLLKNRVNCDCAVLDATVGDYDDDFRLGTHNSIPMLRLIIAAAKGNQIFKKDALIVADHLARTLHRDDLTTKKILSEFGVTMAVDGLACTV